MIPEHPHKAEIDMLREQAARDRAEIAAWRAYSVQREVNDRSGRMGDWDAHDRSAVQCERLLFAARSLAGPEIPPDPRDATIARLEAKLAKWKAFGSALEAVWWPDEATQAELKEANENVSRLCIEAMTD